MREQLTRREFIERTTLAVASATALHPSPTNAAQVDSAIAEYPVGMLEPVPAIRQRPEWMRFIVLVWQYQNDVRRDWPLYDLAGLHGFHIDRGADAKDRVQLSLKRKFPYYVDHAAGKGILYLHKDVQKAVTGKNFLFVRPYSLADPQNIAALKSQLRDNVNVTKKGLVYAYAFDDEISLGSFNSAAEVDIHPRSVAWYRRWLTRRYGSIQSLNAAWATAFSSFDDVQPRGFEEVRRAASAPPLSSWNLSQWMDWRHFMDYQFAQVLADLTRYTNGLDSHTPAGFVGGQQPSAYGGYDYALLCRAVQWMESIELGAAHEIVRSFWNRPRRPHVHTYNVVPSYKQNVWALWNRLAHGNQATIAWPKGWMLDGPSGKRELSPAIQQLAPTFREIQGPAGQFIVNPDSYLETDPIALYYSHPSVRVSWAMDGATNGAGWPKRSASIDDENLSSARLRSSWCTLLEDLGYQYEFISYLDVQEKRIDLARRFKVIILPQTICLSDGEAQALRAFVASGGMLIADALCGLMTETGRGGTQGALDDVFGVRRDESRGYLDGTGITEIDSEYFAKPFPQRLRAYAGALRYRSMVVYERGTRATSEALAETTETAHVLIRKKTGPGQSLYLNLTPLAYEHFPYRAGETGRVWREVMGAALGGIGLRPRVEVYGVNGREAWMESLLWRNGNRYCLAILKNLSLLTESSHLAAVLGKDIDRDPQRITIRLNLPVRAFRNVRTGKTFENVTSVTDEFKTWEANLYEFALRR
jgi:hypothetical protein